MAVLLGINAGTQIALSDGNPARAISFISLPAESGSSIVQQNYSRGVAISTLDISVLFQGTVTTYSVNELAGPSLPAGLSLNGSTGEITGTPTEATLITELPTVYFTATNSQGSITATNGVTFSVTGPFIELGTVSQDSIAFTTDTDSGDVYWALADSQAVSDAQIIAGTGGDVQTGDSQSVSGSGVIELDLSSYTGTTKFLILMQVAASGAYSNVASQEITILDNLVDVDFEDASWTTTAMTVTSGQTDVFGGTSAFLLAATATNSGIDRTSDLSISGDHTFYVYAKEGNTNFLRVALDNTNTWFDLSAGTVETQNHDSASISEDLGMGWYKCTIVHDCDGTANLALIPSNADNSLAEAVGNSFVLYKPTVLPV